MDDGSWAAAVFTRLMSPSGSRLEGMLSLGTGKGYSGVRVIPLFDIALLVGEMRGNGNSEAYGVFWPILVLRLLNFTTERPSCILPSSVITAPETPFSPVCIYYSF